MFNADLKGTNATRNCFIDFVEMSAKWKINAAKALIYQYTILSKIFWSLTLYEVSLTTVEKIREENGYLRNLSNAICMEYRTHCISPSDD